jgi:hypothetical protein
MIGLLNEVPDCGPNCSPACEPNCGPECAPECTDGNCAPTPTRTRDSTLTKVADMLVLAIFVVSLYTEIFSFCLYVFSSA